MKQLLKNSKHRKLLYISTSIILVLFATYFITKGNDQVFANDEEPSDGSISLSRDISNSDLELYFHEAKNMWEEAGITAGSSTIEIDATDFSGIGQETDFEVGSYGGEDDVIVWSTPSGWIEYEVEVEEEGLYEISADYFPLAPEDGGSRQSTVLGVEVNGSYPYREARLIELRRQFIDQEDQFDAKGHQIRSLIDEITGWKTSSFRDSEGATVSPLLFHFEEGVNTIRLNLIRDAVAIQSLELNPPSTYQSYEEVVAERGSSSVTDEVVLIEAEDFALKNSTSIQVLYNRDPLTTPESLQKTVFNSLGGWSWSRGNQQVTWEVEVPEAGEYRISLRALQNFNSNLSIFRTVYINGEVPFEEMKAYQIPYSSGWQEVILSDEDGEPYLFELEAGTNTITFESTHEPYVPLLAQIDALTLELRGIAEELRRATGSREDTFRVWNVREEIPGLIEQLEDMQVRLENMSAYLTNINGTTSNVSQAFDSLSRDIANLLKKPNDIPNRQISIGTLQESIGNQRQGLIDSPLELEKFYLTSEDAEFPRVEARWYERIWGVITSLIYSFSGENELAAQQDDELNVWMMWGRDYAQELQQLADQYFTPEHGITVNVNLIQDPNLLIMANAAGIMPDLAIGIPSNIPYEMALRGAAKDLSTLDGFDEIIDLYAPGAALPYYYDEGYYGLPETINFKILFYREDILDELDLEVPDTWDDVYEMLPTLLQNQYNFFAQPQDFSYMFYQNDVELYRPGGLTSGLDTPQAFEAFQEWTDLFNLRGLDIQVQSFYQQFRNGTFPIGIADFNNYMQLLVAAPEILDVWGVAPVPGRLNEDGVIERWAGGTGLHSTGMMLFNSTAEEKQDVAWEFLKWYASTEIQTEFGLNLEQFNGEQFRWNSSNIEAFAQMPWRQEDLDAILEQWQWVKDIPNAPGGYMTTRQIDFAWNQVVIQNGNPREELEIAVNEINRELRRKQYEFGLVDEEGNVLHELHIPVIDEPWEGAKRFVE